MENILNKFSLKGKTVLVTGGAGLLGKQFALSLAQAGAKVMVADFAYDLAKDYSDSLNKQGLQTEALAVDITDSLSVKEIVEFTLKRFGRLDALVNSAAMDPKFDPAHQGQQSANAFETYPLSAWQDAIDVNLTGLFLACQAAVIPMLEQGSGVIVNICSTYGLVGPDQRIYERDDGPQQFKPVYYSVTKAGILGMTRYLATYYAGKNIRVNALTPGGVYNGHDETFMKAYSARTVLGRMAALDEMSGAMLFLVSDASSYMTGSNLVVDGGWTAW